MRVQNELNTHDKSDLRAKMKVNVQFKGAQRCSGENCYRDSR